MSRATRQNSGVRQADATATFAAKGASLLASVHDPFWPKLGAAVVATPPTVTHSSNPPSGMLSAYYVDGTLLASVTLRGCLVADRSIGGNVALINASSGYLGTRTTVTSAAIYPPFWVEFDFYGDQFVLQTIPLGSSAVLWIWVDGQPITATPTAMSSVTAGAATFSTVAFGSTALRRIRVLVPAYTGLRRIYYPNTGSITPTGKMGKSLAIVGDSWIDGVGTTSTSQAIPTTVELATGLEVYRMGQGGTGYTNPGGGAGQTQDAFGGPSRLSALADIQPDYILVHGSSNDDGATSAALTSAATSYYNALATTCPKAKVIVVGPQNTTGTATATRLAQAAAVKSAAQAAPNVIAYADPTTTNPWITGTGSSTAPTGTGSADWANNGSQVGHLTQAGYDYWARRVAGVVRAAVAATS